MDLRLSWGSAKNSNYTLSENLGTLEVTESSGEITFRAPTAEKTYDGTELTKSDGATLDHSYWTANVGGEWTAAATAAPGSVTLGTGETITFNVTGSQTEVGNSDNMYSIDWGSNTSSMFLSQTTGQLVVNGDEQGPKTPGVPQGPQGPQGNTGAPPDGSDSSDRPNDGLEPTLPPAVEEVTKTVQTDEHAHHHQPIRFGVSLRYQLNRSWSIESGIVVTQHTSDFDITQRTTINDQQTTISSTQAPPVTSRQRLVYVGIPLHLNYRIWGSRHFTLYASAGGTVEKMVWGRKDTDVTTSNGLKSHTRQSLGIKPLQLSVDGAIGAEYKFSNSFSLYAEPGLGYYFDNGSSVPTIYQERPLNFNLNLGLRFGINVSR